MDLRGRTVLVTGAAGFIGGWLAQRLATREGAYVRGLVQPSDQGEWLKRLGVEAVVGDVRDAARMQEVAAGCDTIFHSAAWLGQPPSAEAAWSTNVAGTENVLAASSGATRFVHVSTFLVYGPLTTGVVDESQPLGTWHPTLDPYGATKVAAERCVFRFSKETGLSVTVIRPSNVYGPRATGWVPRGLRKIRNGRPILIGGGHGFAHPVYVENLVDGILLAACSQRASGEAYNITDGMTMTWHDFYDRYGRLISRRPRSIPVPLAYALAVVRELRGRFTGKVPSLTRALVRQVTGRAEYRIEKACRQLGYEPRVGFEEAMDRIEDWQRNGGDLLQERAFDDCEAVHA